MDKLYNYYDWVATYSDPRTKGWLLIDSPVPLLYVAAFYLTIVFIGPKIMKSRKPFEINTLIIVYNILMSLFNLHMFMEYYSASRNLKYDLFCQANARDSVHPDEARLTRVSWLFFISKVLEFGDTFFFILRKKDRQLSFLHVYHHSTMIMFCWMGTKWVPSGSSSFGAMTNSFIHVIMYGYYALAAMGPSVAPYLWWKKYLTVLQLVQFASVLLLSVNGIRLSCGFPPAVFLITCFYMVSYLVLFGKFYATTYKTKEVASSKSKTDKEEYVFNNNEMENTKANSKVYPHGIMKKKA